MLAGLGVKAFSSVLPRSVPAVCHGIGRVWYDATMDPLFQQELTVEKLPEFVR